MTEDWAEVGDRIYVRRHASLDRNCGLVVGTEGCLVIDTRSTAEQGADLAAAVRRVSALPWQILTTHAHYDHCFGTAAFGPVRVWGHRAMAADLAAAGEQQRDRLVEMLTAQDRTELAGQVKTARIVLPTDLVERDAVVALGDRQIRLVHRGRGHTDGDLSACIDGVLFAGDLVEEGNDPAFEDSFPLEWADTLTSILNDADPVTVVPGHGAVLDPVDARRQAQTLADLAAALNAALDAGGRSVDALAPAARGLGLGGRSTAVAAARALGQTA